MSFDVDIGHTTERASRAVDEDFAAAARHAPHEESLGFIAAIADGVSTGGQGLMAAQTSVMSLVEDSLPHRRPATPPWCSTA